MSSLSEFQKVKFLGKGSFGTVYKVKRKSDNRDYALKEINIKSMSQIEREEAVNEIRILASVNHPSVIRYCDSFYEQDKLYIILDFAEHGDLYHVIKKKIQEKSLIDEDTIWSYFIQICVGMEALHKQKVLHRDLKCHNIFLTKNNIVKIGDLGVAKLLKFGVTKTTVGTPYYMCPEIWMKMPYDSKSDVWSLGCVLYELVTLRPPFTGDSSKALAQRVKTGRYPKIPEHFSPDLEKLISKLLAVNPALRPSVTEILQSKAVESRLHLLPPSVLEYFHKERPQKEIQPKSNMIATIKVPRNLGKLQEHLPGPSYPGQTIVVHTEQPVIPKPVVKPAISVVQHMNIAPITKENVKPDIQLRPRTKPELQPKPALPLAPRLVDKGIARDRYQKPTAYQLMLKQKSAKPIAKPAAGKENLPKEKVQVNISEEIKRINNRRKALEEILNKRPVLIKEGAIQKVVVKERPKNLVLNQNLIKKYNVY